MRSLQIKMALDNQNTHLELSWYKFKSVLQKYPNIFGEKFIDRGLYYNLQGQVAQRCVGKAQLKSESMVPLMDCLNHAAV